jgi:hypothetical protein
MQRLVEAVYTVGKLDHDIRGGAGRARSALGANQGLERARRGPVVRVIATRRYVDRDSRYPALILGDERRGTNDR